MGGIDRPSPNDRFMSLGVPPIVIRTTIGIVMIIEAAT